MMLVDRPDQPDELRTHIRTDCCCTKCTAAHCSQSVCRSDMPVLMMVATSGNKMQTEDHVVTNLSQGVCQVHAEVPHPSLQLQQLAAASLQLAHLLLHSLQDGLQVLALHQPAPPHGSYPTFYSLQSILHLAYAIHGTSWICYTAILHA